MKIRKFFALAAGASILAFATPAAADWKSVETDHFIYYSEDEVAQVKQNVIQLEIFDKLVRALTGNQAPPSTVKVRIFELKDMDELNRYLGSQGVGGFYNNNDVGPYIFTFRESVKDRSTAFKSNTNTFVWAPEVRQHEYLHHYMYQYFNSNYPSWYSEGFAEYYGSMAFPEENVVEIGHAPQFRMDALKSGAWLPVEKLLTARSYGEVKDLRALYAQGWLLTHFAARNPERGKQLADFLNRIARGETYPNAAKAAFGDLNALNKELRAHRNNIQAVRLSLKPIDVGTVTVNEMSSLDSQLFEYMMRINIGIRDRDLGQIRSYVRELRQADPDNMLGLEVQSALAMQAEDFDEALAMAERMLKNDPDSVMGKYLKGAAMVELVPDGSADSAYDEARLILAEAAKADPNNPEPLIGYYRSYLKTDALPPAEAQNALMRAFELLPGYDLVRLYVARDFEWRGMYEDAIYVVSPAAFGTFEGDEYAKRRRQRNMDELVEKYGKYIVPDSPKEMLARLEAKRDGRWDEANQTNASEGAESVPGS